VTKDMVIREACRQAKANRIALYVVKDRYADDPSDPFGYGPRLYLSRLYPGGTIIGVANERGEFEAI